jgi:hypothetical protein
MNPLKLSINQDQGDLLINYDLAMNEEDYKLFQKEKRLILLSNYFELQI